MSVYLEQSKSYHITDGENARDTGVLTVQKIREQWFANDVRKVLHLNQKRTGGIVMKFGYGRVSTKAQNEARQVQALLEAGVEISNMLIDKTSGKDFERPQYQLLKEKLRQGDTVVFLSLDRMGRNYKETQTEWQWFVDKGVDIQILDFPLLNTKGVQDKGLDAQFVADLVFKVMLYLADKERLKILERTEMGRAIAKSNGTKFGRKSLVLPADFDYYVTAWKRRQLNLAECVRQSGLGRTSFCKYANERWAEVQAFSENSTYK